MMTTKRQKPKPLFDTIQKLQFTAGHPTLSPAQNQDYRHAYQFLDCYQNNVSTFNAYRREVERLLQWYQSKSDKSLKQLHREDIDTYIKFCQTPPKSWIGIKKVSRFINDKNGLRTPKRYQSAKKKKIVPEGFAEEIEPI